MSIKEKFFNSKTVPLIVAVTVIAASYVLIRMQSLEQDYKSEEVRKNLSRVNLKNKELKAKKAELISIQRLQKISKEHNLEEPKSKQIIVIP